MSDDYTPISELPAIYEALQATFRTGLTKPIAWRRRQLLQLARFAKEEAHGLADAIRLDLGKPKQEVIMAEVSPIIERSLICAEKVEEWARTEPITVQPWQQSWNPRIEKHPKGVVLIIAPWNYPMILSLQPLYGAIAAGCCALIKPSEISPHYSSFLAKNLGKYLDPNAYRVALGGVPEITRILEFKWDHIFYTGNGKVGRIISAAAAKHLTPLTLELGGKSPVLIDGTANIALTARRILFGKVNNAGQICVSPDFVLALRPVVPLLVDALKEVYGEFYGGKSALESESYGFIVSEYHFGRLKGLLGRTRGRVVLGGKWDDEPGKRGFEPTVVVDVEPGDSLLEEELFGPILPIVAVDSIDEAIEYLNSRDHPLTMYIFSSDEENKKKIIANTYSGGVSINDTFMQVSMNEMPFGGVGESGHGRQVLKYSFDNFTYERGVSDTPYEDEPNFAARYPPYTKESYAFFASILDTHIPAE